MSLAIFQRTLLLIYTNEKVLANFFKDKEAYLSELELTEREKKALKGLQLEEIERFAKELRIKRLVVSRKIINSEPVNTSPVFIFPSHRLGPTLFFKTLTGEHEIQIGPGLYGFFTQLIKKHGEITTKSVLETYYSDESVTLSDFFRAIQLTCRYRLLGRTVRNLS